MRPNSAASPPIGQIITYPAGRCAFFKIKTSTDAALSLYSLSATMKEWRTARLMFVRKIEELLYKNTIHKNNLILLGDVDNVFFLFDLAYT